MAPRKMPLRTCVACRREADKRELMRFVRGPEGDVRVDETGKATGRGASVCYDLRCFDTAVGKKRLGAALRASLTEDDVERLRSEFEMALRHAGPADSRSGR